MYAKSFVFRRTPIQRFFSTSVPQKKIGITFLIRHAESDHNTGGGCCAGLNNSSKPTVPGIEQTRIIGKLLSQTDIKFDDLYVSPLDRAVLTAEALNLSVNTILHEALVERNFGGFTGMSKKAIKEQISHQKFHEYIRNKDFFPPDITPGHPYFHSKKLYGSWPNNHKGESYQCVINRLIPFLAEIKEKVLNNQNILIVGHSHNLQILQMLLHGTAFEQGIEKYKLEHVAPIKFIFSPYFSIREKVNLVEETSVTPFLRS